MKGIRKTPFFIIAAAVLLLCVAARADVCLLKAGSYATTSGTFSGSDIDGTTRGVTVTGTPSGTTCATAVGLPYGTTSGSSTDTIHINVNAGSPFTLDLIYAQDPVAADPTRYLAIGTFYAKFNLDNSAATDMISPANCDNNPADAGTACATPSCTGVPKTATYNPATAGATFKPTTPSVLWDYAASGNSCATKFADDSNNYDYFYGFGAFDGPSVSLNFVMDSITFTGSNLTQGYTYTFAFDTTSSKLERTQIINSDGCDTLLPTPLCQDGSSTAVPQQHVWKTEIHVIVPACQTNPLGALPQAPTCKGTPPGCSAAAGSTPATGTATFTLFYQDPTTITCTAASCTPAKITFTSPELGGAHTLTSGTSLVVPLPDGVGLYNTIPITAFTLTGTAGVCTSAAGVSVPATPCTCGSVPTVALIDNSQLSGTFIQGQDVVLKFKVTLDTSLSLPGDIPSDGLKFYYTNNTGASTYQEIDVRPNLANDTTGDFTATIPGSYVVANTPIYFGVVAKDKYGAEGKYPADLDITSNTTLVNTTSDPSGYSAIGLTAGKIIAGTKFDFIPGQEPYPNMFPFRANGQVLKIFFTLDCKSDISAQIYSLDGTMIRHLDNNTNTFSACNAGAQGVCNMCTSNGTDTTQNGCLWDGTTYQGGNHYVANGMYIINIHATCIDPTSPYKGNVLDYTKGIVVMK